MWRIPPCPHWCRCADGSWETTMTSLWRCWCARRRMLLAAGRRSWCRRSTGSPARGSALSAPAVALRWRRKRNRFYGKLQCDRSMSAQMYMVGYEGHLWLRHLWDRHGLRDTKIPFTNRAILTHRVDDIVLLVISESERRDALSVPFQIRTLLYLPDVPYLEQAVIPARYDPILEGIKFNHPDARLMSANHVSFVVREAIVLGELSQLDLW